MERAVRVLRHPVFVIVLVTLLGGWLRFSNLSFPRELVFDETYYAKDACVYLSEGPKECGLNTLYEQSWVHPPLGKWMIAGGEAIFGGHTQGPDASPFGWRFSSALFGTATVALTAILAWVLTQSALWAGVGGLLLATENLSFVQSRMSMLDIFLAFWMVVAFLCMALDRKWIERQERADPEPDDLLTPARSVGPGAMADVEFPSQPGTAAGYAGAPPTNVASPVIRRWRLAAGLAFGAGAAVKWSGATTLILAIPLAFGWEVARRRRAGRDHPFRDALFQESFGILVCMVLAPLVVYVASYVVWLNQHSWSLTELVRHHGDMLGFHWHLKAHKPNGDLTHPYQSQAWTWLFMARPVSYYYKGPTGTAAEIIGMGNPAVFWGSLFAVPFVVTRWIRRKDWTSGLVAVGFLAQYLPWLPVNRPIFLFYMTPIVPFMVLAEVFALRSMAEHRSGHGAQPFAALAALLVGISVTLFAFFHPILVGETLSTAAWHARMWFRSWI